MIKNLLALYERLIAGALHTTSENYLSSFYLQTPWTYQNTSGNKPYKLGVNHLADLTLEEFKDSRNGLKRTYEFSTTTFKLNGFKYENVTDIPEAIDWRVKGAVTPIINQACIIFEFANK